MTPAPCYVGIDVAKARLDVAVRPGGEIWSATNDAAGITALVARLHELQPALVVLEATGGYERPLAAALAGAGLSTAVVNPRQARDFAKATGRLAKTDALDARALAHFAEAVKPAARPEGDAGAPDAVAAPLTPVPCRRSSAGGVRRQIGAVGADRQEAHADVHRVAQRGGGERGGVAAARRALRDRRPGQGGPEAAPPVGGQGDHAGDVRDPPETDQPRRGDRLPVMVAHEQRHGRISRRGQ